MNDNNEKDEKVTDKNTTLPRESAGSSNGKGTSAEPTPMSEEEAGAVVRGMVDLIRSVPPDRSDAGLAAWLGAETMQGKFAYVDGLEWMLYDEKQGIYRSVAKALMKGIVSRFLVGFAEKTIKVADPEDKAAAIRDVKPLLTAKKAGDVLQLLPERLYANVASFDARPTLMCVGNGVVDLTTGKLRKHSPKYRFTMRTPVNLVADARSDDFDKVLSSVAEDSVDWLQLRFGQAATGIRTTDDRVVFLHGDGGNGKTVMMKCVRLALGDYFVDAPRSVVLGGKGVDGGPEIMALRGARFVLVEELPDGGQLSETSIKDLAGTEYITGKALYKDPISFKATHSTFVDTNTKPTVRENDRGTWRRLAMLAWNWLYLTPAEVEERAASGGVLADHEREGDQTIRQRIEDDPKVAEAALAWVVAGAVKYYDMGQVFPVDPPSVAKATMAWRESNDVIMSFSNSGIIVFCEDCAVVSGDLLGAFNEYLGTLSRNKWSDKTFVDRFLSHEAVKSRKVAKIRWQSGELPKRLSRYTSAEFIGEALRSRPWLFIGIRFEEPMTAEEIAEMIS